MPLDDFRHQRNAPFRRHIWQSHQPGVRHIMQIDQRPKVGVDRHYHPVQRRSQFQQSTIAGVRA